MYFEGCYYPTDKSNPSAKTPEEAKENPSGLDYSCIYCKEHGICFTTVGGDTMVVKPCSICAMNNGGVWGWSKNEDGTYEKIKTSGIIPGNDGITDVILSHTTIPPKREYEPLMEEIILGYVQYALYCHLKWEDIMDFKEGPSKEHGRPSNSYYRLGKGSVWHWWKLIRLGGLISAPGWEGDEDIFDSKLPKRFCKLLKEILSIVRSPGRNESWEDFWKTEVEPVDVCCIYSYVMKRVLDRHVDRNVYYSSNQRHVGVTEEAYKCEDYKVTDYVSTTFDLMSNPDTVPYCERGIAWIFDHVDPKFYGNPDFPLCDPRDVAEHFYVSYFDEVNGRYTHIQKVLEVHEHDIFGTSLKLIINETHDWFIDSNICTILAYMNNIPSILNQRWLTVRMRMVDEVLIDINNHISLEEYIHHSVLCQLTYQAESTSPIQRQRINYVIDDYTSEYEFRVNFDSENTWELPILDPETESFNNEYPFLIGAPPFRVNISNIEYEVDDGDEKEINDEKNKKIRDHLMGVQMIIEEDVKDHVNEGTYLKIMDKLKDIYTELN